MVIQFGDKGTDVARWQEELVQCGQPIAVSGDFGKETHQETLELQAAAGLRATGIVTAAEWAAARAGRKSWPMREPPRLAEAIPYIECRCWDRSVSRSAVQHIVIHCMEAPETASTAENCAHYLATLPDLDKDGKPEPKRSVHYYVDCDSVVQGVPDNRVAWHAPGVNHSAIGIEHAGFSRQTRAEWLDAFGSRMLALSAQLTARLCKRWGIPPVFLMAGELIAGRSGITTHAQVTAAFHRSTHTDPGLEFPVSWYLAQVEQALRFKEESSS